MLAFCLIAQLNRKFVQNNKTKLPKTLTDLYRIVTMNRNDLYY